MTDGINAGEASAGSAADGPGSISAAAGPRRIALDLLGGDASPQAVLDGALEAIAKEGDGPAPQITLVGPAGLADRLLADRDVERRFAVAPASQVVEMDEDPARAVRAKRDATVRVAARLVRDGQVDAMVSTGSTGAAMAAALFTLGRVSGMTRPALAVVIPTTSGGIVLLDVGANVTATPDLLAQFALAGAAYSGARFDLGEPRVGLLSVGAEAGKGDALRKEAFDLLDDLPIDFVGNVEGGEVATGRPVDVVVADGFSGNVLLKGLEGAYRLVVERLSAAGYDEAELRRTTAPLDPEVLGGAVLLGVDGVCVVGHGSPSPRAVASCIDLATRAVTEGLVSRTAAALTDRLARRRLAAEPALAVAPRAG
jgi:glycerol-3-phosphate acyltransferase PlsX